MNANYTLYKNKNGLLEWLTEPDYTECKCGESGLDNSPRFDFDEEMDEDEDQDEVKELDEYED